LHTVLREFTRFVTKTQSVKLVVVLAANVFTAIANMRAAHTIIASAYMLTIPIVTVITHHTQKARVIRVRAALLLRYSVLCSSSVSRAA
jgi:uncharacterized protein YaaW (UPF0174 family)